MSARRIALLISSVALIVFATPVASANAEIPTLSELRTELRQVRTRLARATGTLTSARTDLREVRDLIVAGGGLPIVLTTTPAPEETTDPTTTDPTTTDPTTTDPTTTTDDTTTGPAATDVATIPSTGDPTIDTPIAALRPALATRLLADGTITRDEVTALEGRVLKWRRIVRRLRRAENDLEARIALRLQIAEWNRRGEWRPLIEIAAQRNHVSRDGLYRLMMLESGGRRYAGSTFKGLFQYYPGTWRASWNPWRAQSIYNGWAQIQATAYAIGRGMGPANWPSTYPVAF